MEREKERLRERKSGGATKFDALEICERQRL